MKRSAYSLPLKSIITLLIIISVNKVTLSQPPLPPKTNTGNQINNSGNGADAAPVGEGIWILIALAASYGVNRYIRKMEESPDKQLLKVSGEDTIDTTAN